MPEGAGQPLGVPRIVRRVDWEAPPKPSSLTTLFVFYNSSVEACYQKPEGKKKQRKTRETNTDREKEKETGREGGRDGDYGIHSDVKKKKLFIYQMTVLETIPHQNRNRNKETKNAPTQQQ